MSESADIIAFGPFRLDPQRRQLLRGDEPVALSSRAFDILALLAANRGRVVSKDEIMSHVWRGMIVEENNLAVQISALRRALADSGDAAPTILTIPGQGYRFVARVQAAGPVPPAAAPQPLPVPVTARARRGVFMWAAALVPMVALTVALAVFFLMRPAPQPPVAAPPAPPRLSIAVLPFRDLSDDRCCDYLADAISDDLTTDLSHIPGSVVIARESSDAFRGRAVPTGEIGRALNVRYLLEGSLRGVEGQFSINAQLIEASSGAHLWAEHFEVPRDHLADAQQRIVRRLASALGVTLVDIEGSASLRERAQNPDALDLFLRARSILDRSDTLESMTQAQHLLEQAIALKPGFTEAQAELAWLLARKVRGLMYPSYAADLAEAHAVLAAALSPAAGQVPMNRPGVALALAAKGALQYYDGHCEEAGPSFQAALAIQSDSVAAQTGLVVCQIALGQFDQALAGLQSLQRFDPEGPRNKMRAQQTGLSLLMLGRGREAVSWLERSLSGDPESAPGADDLGRVEWGRLLLIAACEQAGDHARAVGLYKSYAEIWPYRSVWQLGSLFTRAQSRLPGFAALLESWRKVGMPQVTDTGAGAGAVPDDGGIHGHRAMEPTPSRLHDVPGIETAALAAALRGPHPPLVVDFGPLAAVPPGAAICDDDPLSAADMAKLAQRLASAPQATMPGAPAIRFVIMGRSPVDWSAVNAARQLMKAGLAQLAWYRGGEEAWAHSGEPAEDRRPQ